MELSGPSRLSVELVLSVQSRHPYWALALKCSFTEPGIRCFGRVRTSSGIILHDNIGIDEVMTIDHFYSWFEILADMGIVPDLSGGKVFGLNELVAVMLADRFADAKAVKNHRDYRRRVFGEDNETLADAHRFVAPRAFTLKLPGLRYAVPVLIDAPRDDDAFGLIKELIADSILPEDSALKVRASKREGQKVNPKSIENLKRPAGDKA